MTDTSKATGRPWVVLPGVPHGGGIGIGPEIEGIGPHTIVTFNGGESEAFAALIVARVNGWEALEAERDALREALAEMVDYSHCRAANVHERKMQVEWMRNLGSKHAPLVADLSRNGGVGMSDAARAALGKGGAA